MTNAIPAPTLDGPRLAEGLYEDEYEYEALVPLPVCRT